MDVESGRLRRWRLASSVTPPSLALGLPFGIPGITGNGRAGVTLGASCRARAAELEVGDKIGRPLASLCLFCLELGLFGFLSLGLGLGPCLEGLSACFGYASTSWTTEFQKMSPPMAFSPRHRQTVVMTDGVVRRFSAQERRTIDLPVQCWE